jgi:predicted esterase
MITLLHTGCTGKNNVVTPAKGLASPHLVAFEKKFTYSAEQLKNKYGIISEHIKNGFSAYRLTYKTTNVDGKQVIASGAVLVPDVKKPLPLMNYNHGTYFPSNERSAPGYLSQYNSEVMMGGLFSSMGYLIVMPDYIGYGATKELKHPYCAYNFIAATCIDMLRATREFCDSQKVKLNNKNFFTGWSEGGGVALAVVKNIEEKFADEFTVTAAAPMAGAYYSSGFAEYVLNNKEDFPYINSYAWVLQTYNWLYKINKPLSYYFNEPYAGRLEKNPEATIPLKPNALFTPTFKKDYANGAASALQKALEENDLWNWKPKSKIVLCHGEKDMYVPFFNSKKTYEAMKAKGADVTLAAYPGRGHSDCMPQYLETIYSTFEKLR